MIRLALVLAALPAALVLAALPAALVLAALPAAAQIREFNCVGAAALDDDSFAVGFAARSDRLGEEARSPLEAAAELARRSPQRNICVLGHALSTEGGTTTGQRLAAARAREVALELARLGIERDRVRAEARVAGFTRSTAARPARGATIVVMP